MMVVLVLRSLSKLALRFELAQRLADHPGLIPPAQLTTMPAGLRSPAPSSSYAWSMTRLRNMSYPRSTPETARPPWMCTYRRRSMNSAVSGLVVGGKQAGQGRETRGIEVEVKHDGTS